MGPSSLRLRGPGGHSGRVPGRQEEESADSTGEHPDVAAEEVPDDESAHEGAVGLSARSDSDGGMSLPRGDDRRDF